MINITLPDWASKMLASCPSAGDGVHNWLFRTALMLHGLINDPDEIEELLKAATANCGRDVPDSEIADAVRNSKAVRENPAGRIQCVRRWPTPNQDRMKAIVREGPTFAQLEDLSPHKWTDHARHTEEIIDHLFPRDPLVCAGRTQSQALTRTREQWRGFLEKQQFIVPSPMSVRRGVTKSGKTSMRTLDNTGPRRFLVVEFDTGTFDQHAAILWHLAKFAPLVLVVHSGNKSAHGWFYCADAPEPAVEKFFRYAVSLGADPATWTRCQWVRMPDGIRDNGRRQQVIFFNPKPLEGK